MELIKGKEYKTKKENKIYTGYYTGIETTNGFLFELSDDPSKGWDRDTLVPKDWVSIGDDKYWWFDEDDKFEEVSRESQHPTLMTTKEFTGSVYEAMGGGEINEPQADVSVIERVREAISKLGFQGGEEEEFNKYVKKAWEEPECNPLIEFKTRSVWKEEINNNKNMTIKQTFKKLTMSKADKNLIKAGVVNDELELTNSGRDLVVDLMFNNKDIKAEIAKMAEAIVKEQEDC